MIELDRAYVLMREGDTQWWVKAHHESREKPSSHSAERCSPGASENDDTLEDASAAEPGSGTGSTSSGNARLDVPLPSGSRLLLQRVIEKRQTVIYEPENYKHTIGSSIMLLDRAVASPIFDEHGNVIAALYGDRSYATAHAESVRLCHAVNSVVFRRYPPKGRTEIPTLIVPVILTEELWEGLTCFPVP